MQGGAGSFGTATEAQSRYIRRVNQGTFGYIRVHSGTFGYIRAKPVTMFRQFLQFSSFQEGTFGATTYPFIILKGGKGSKGVSVWHLLVPCQCPVVEFYHATLFPHVLLWRGGERHRPTASGGGRRWPPTAGRQPPAAAVCRRPPPPAATRCQRQRERTSLELCLWPVLLWCVYVSVFALRSCARARTAARLHKRARARMRARARACAGASVCMRPARACALRRVRARGVARACRARGGARPCACACPCARGRAREMNMFGTRRLRTVWPAAGLIKF